MTRGTMLALAMSGLVLAGTPFTAANAQSGDALAHAERACSEAGVRPYSSAYNTCVDRAADDFYRGAPELAYDSAHIIVSARILPAINGLDIHVLEAGAGKGRPAVLLLHGFPELAYSWRKVLPALAAAGYHAIAPDQRGYGRTTGWSKDYDADLSSFRF